jgi:hypothetical protein
MQAKARESLPSDSLLMQRFQVNYREKVGFLFELKV